MIHAWRIVLSTLHRQLFYWWGWWLYRIRACRGPDSYRYSSGELASDDPPPPNIRQHPPTANAPWSASHRHHPV